jgi:hypothetical protein
MFFTVVFGISNRPADRLLDRLWVACDDNALFWQRQQYLFTFMSFLPLSLRAGPPRSQTLLVPVFLCHRCCLFDSSPRAIAAFAVWEHFRRRAGDQGGAGVARIGCEGRHGAIKPNRPWNDCEEYMAPLLVLLKQCSGPKVETHCSGFLTTSSRGNGL